MIKIHKDIPTFIEIKAENFSNKEELRKKLHDDLDRKLKTVEIADEEPEVDPLLTWQDIEKILVLSSLFNSDLYPQIPTKVHCEIVLQKFLEIKRGEK